MSVIARMCCATLVVLLVGCGSIEPVPSDTFYRLQQSALTPSPGSKLEAGTVFVEKVRASGVHRERALVHSDAEGVELTQHHYEHWIESPAIMLRERLVRHLRHHLGAEALANEPHPHAKFIVRTRLEAFEIHGSEGRVALSFTVNERGSDVPVLVEQYTSSSSGSGSDTKGAVSAISSAVDDIYTKFVNDLTAKIASR